jgi:hypothetical protein
MKKTIVIFGTILFIAISSCSNKEVKDEAIETVDSSAIAPQPKLDSIPNQSKSFNGNYTNSQGAILTITNFIASEGFTLKYSDNSKGTPCSGNAWEGKVALVSATNGDLTSADGQIEGAIEFKGDNIHFELSADIISMECARYFDTDFVKK